MQRPRKGMTALRENGRMTTMTAPTITPTEAARRLNLSLDQLRDLALLFADIARDPDGFVRDEERRVAANRRAEAEVIRTAEAEAQAERDRQRAEAVDRWNARLAREAKRREAYDAALAAQTGVQRI